MARHVCSKCIHVQNCAKVLGTLLLVQFLLNIFNRISLRGKTDAVDADFTFVAV